MLARALARLRLLSYGQIARSVLPGRSPQAIGQRVKRLVTEGWVTIWDQPVRSGGRPRFILATARMLRWATDELTSLSQGASYERLLDSMLPGQPRRPLELDPVSIPPFFAHLSETNDLVLALETRGPVPVLWASTWERPFPPRAKGLRLPQPDAVLVLEGAPGPRLVFLEHDRGMESLAHFRSAKVERYADLSVRPELCEELLGFRSFEVWVSVLDRRFRRPLERLTTLAKLAVEEGTEELIQFTLAGWLHADPAGRIWFRHGLVADSRSLRPEEHGTAASEI